jgi:hypothetical protein
MYATIDFRISSIETSEIESFQIIETQCNLEGANEFGQVTDGALLVSGQLRDDVGLDPFDDGLERNVLLAWPPHDCIGKVFSDEPVEPGARLWCLPILVKTIYPSSLGGDIKGYDGETNFGEDLYPLDGEDAIDIPRIGSEYQEIERIDEGQESAKNIASPESVDLDQSEDVLYLWAPRNIKGKQKLLADEKPIVCCLVLLPTGIKQEEYRRIGIVELEDWESFENVPERILTIV